MGMLFWLSKRVLLNNLKVVFFYKQKSKPRKSFFFILALHLCLKQRMWSFKRDSSISSYGMSKTISCENLLLRAQAMEVTNLVKGQAKTS
jgi:hypothetical protein